MAIIQSGASSDALIINPTSKAARTMLHNEDGSSLQKLHGSNRGSSDQAIPIAYYNDDSYRFARSDRLGSQSVALNNLLFSEQFEGATAATPNRLTSTAASFVTAQTAAGGFVVNSTNITTSAANFIMTSNRQFARYQRAPTHLKLRARASHQANSVIEFGFGNATATVSPTVGAFFQITTGGVIQGVLTFNGVNITTTPITLTGSWRDNFYVWDIILDDDEVMFFIQDTSTGFIIAERRIQIPTTQVRTWNATRLPFFARLNNITAPASPPNLVLSSVDVIQLDLVTGKPWSHTLALNGMGFEVNPTTFAQTINYANSAAPTSATLSNTAAGYTTLGGQFQFAAVAGAETDYALFGFTVPSPYSLVVTGIDISTFNMGAAVATTPTLLQWFASTDQTAISLATATNRRVAIGAQSLPVGTPIGGMADRNISTDLSQSPLVTNPGRIFVIGLKMPVGTATASQIIRGTVAIKGYFE